MPQRARRCSRARRRARMVELASFTVQLARRSGDNTVCFASVKECSPSQRSVTSGGMRDHAREMKTVSAAERPDLAERAWEETTVTMPEYNLHGDVINAYWDRLNEERPRFQFYLLGDDDEILARA